MIDENKLNDYKQRQREWRDISVTQLSNTNNILLTLSTGLLAFCFDKSKITNIHFDLYENILWADTTFVIAILLLATSICYGISVLVSRLYDFRISRHIAFTRQRVYANQDGKTLPDDDLGEFNCCHRANVLWQVIFCKLPFIKIDQTKKAGDEKALKENFAELRKISKVLGIASWRWTKFESAFFLLSCLVYFIHLILIK